MDTKIVIASSLIHMLKHDDLKSIQVSEIAEKANITTRTIQRKFNGKESIVEYYLSYIMDTELHISSNISDNEVIIEFFKFWYLKKHLIRLLKERNLTNLFLKVVKDQIKVEVSKEAKGHFVNDKDKPIHKYIINIITHSIVSIFETWIEYDFDQEFDEFKEVIIRTLDGFDAWMVE